MIKKSKSQWILWGIGVEIIPTMSSSVVYAMDNEVKFYIKAHIISILNVFTILFFRIMSIPSSKFVRNLGKWKKYHKGQSFWEDHKIVSCYLPLSFDKIFTVDLTFNVVCGKLMVKISSIFVVFSENLNIIYVTN